MRKIISTPSEKKLLLALLTTGILFCTQLSINAQQLNIREFVLFGANSTQIGTSTTVTGGRIGSNKLVQTIGNTNISAQINSANRVELANSNTINGNITAQNQLNASGTIFAVGSNFSFPSNKGEIHVGGNVVIGSGTIRGTLYMPQGATYSGPRVNRLPNPVFPTIPALPVVSNFVPVGTNDVTATGPVSPNQAYGNLTLNGSKTVTFTGTGVYTFNGIKISNSDNRFVFDFRGSSNGLIVIHVYGDADLDRINVQLTGGGDASRVYMEVHGNGSTSTSGKDAWRIANGSSGSTSNIWYGAVWAPNGDIFVGQGSSPAKIEGALWSGTNVVLASGVAISYVEPKLCPPPVANAGTDQT
ncbi:MAG: hypothetical protein M3Q06_07225, partial [Bacteroidota bacterium]|nr:hypothetical protein [Bacteroidota bacterium]